MPKLQADLAAGTAQYDFFCNDIEFQYTIYPSLLPINDLIAERGYDMEGFFEPIYTYGEGVAGGQEGFATGSPSASVRPGSSTGPISSTSSRRPGTTTTPCSAS